MNKTQLTVIVFVAILVFSLDAATRRKGGGRRGAKPRPRVTHNKNGENKPKDDAGRDNEGIEGNKTMFDENRYGNWSGILDIYATIFGLAGFEFDSSESDEDSDSDEVEYQNLTLTVSKN